MMSDESVLSAIKEHKVMKSPLFGVGAAFLTAVVLAVPVPAQVTPQTVSIEHVDIQKVAAGYRSSKIVGSSVVNDANEEIGEIDDLLVEPSDKVLFAVLSAGGFLGLGERLVVVPFSNLRIENDRVILPEFSKDALKALPAFYYAK
jgi:hypothetical protein